MVIRDLHECFSMMKNVTSIGLGMGMAEIPHVSNEHILKMLSDVG